MSWKTKKEDDVGIVFLDSLSGEEVVVPSNYSVENGTPIDGNGDDMKYLRTEVKEDFSDALLDQKDWESVFEALVTHLSALGAESYSPSDLRDAETVLKKVSDFLEQKGWG